MADQRDEPGGPVNDSGVEPSAEPSAEPGVDAESPDEHTDRDRLRGVLVQSEADFAGVEPDVILKALHDRISGSGIEVDEDTLVAEARRISQLPPNDFGTKGAS